MPARKITFSKCFEDTKKFTVRTGSDTTFCFVREFELWRRYWDCQPAPNPGAVKGTVKKPQPATRQEEADALLMLATQKSTEKSMLILDAGASPNAYTPHMSKRAVVWVVEKRCPVLLRRFIDMGANTDQGYLLQGAMRNERHSLEMVTMLVEAGVPLNSSHDQSNYTDLEVAVLSGNTHVVRYIVGLGADVNQQNPRNHRTPMHHVFCTHGLRNNKWERVAYPYGMELTPPPPAVFVECNPRMFGTLASLGADLTIARVGQTACLQSVNDYKRAVMAERRLAFAMVLQDRLGARAPARGLDEEVVRMVLEFGTPYACPPLPLVVRP
ncbi:hypothetical protein T484DRAFT_1861238 [Baffinella frigidus]|nr:hypothetical protein T484DRAFT_1861238 [Cryptophyta sp. CCMP2293]